MAGNSELIDTVIDPKVYDDYDKLIAKSDEAIAKFVELAKQATAAGNAIGNVRTLRDYNRAATDAAKSTAQLQQAQANAARAAILQQQAEQRLQQAVIATTSAEQRAEAQTRRLAEAENRRTQAAQKALTPYQSLLDVYKKLTDEARNAGIQFGINSYQFQELSNQANGVRTRLDAVDNTLGHSQRNVGNYASGISGLGHSFTRLYGYIRTAANILPGIGISGIFLGLFEGIKYVVEQLGFFSSKITQIAANLAAYNEVNKAANVEAGKQASNLRILYQAATDVTNSIHNRTLAARELQKEFPDTFKNISLETILNGNASASYQQLTKDIIANARAKAVADKLGKIQAELFDSDIQKQKISNAQGQEEAKSIAFYTKALQGQGLAYDKAREAASKATFEQSKYEKQVRKAGGIIATPTAASDPRGANSELNAIRARANDAIKAELEKQRVLKNTQAFLIKLAGGNNAVAAGIAQNDTPKAATIKDDSKENFSLAIKAAKDADDEIQRNENSTYEQRLGSAEKFKKDTFKIIYDAEVAKTITGQKGNSERADIEKQYAADIVNINKDAQKELKVLYDKQIKDAKDTSEAVAKNSLDVADQFGNNQKKIVQDNADDSLLALSDQYAKGLISTQQYQLQKSDIEKQAGIDSDEIEINRLKIRIGIDHQLGLDDQKDKDDLAKAERKRDKDTADYAIAQAQRVADGRKGVAQAEKALGDELLVFGKAIVDAQFTNQLNAIQDQKDALNDRTKNEIDAENRSLDNTSTKADKIAIINAKAAAQQAQLDQKAREAKQKQAQADRIFTIASIVENTAIGVSKALAEYIYPYSAIVAALVGALGAAQIATVLATPIPKYQMGTDYAKGGRSLVGEVGKEYVIQPDGKEYFTPDKPTIMNIPRGSKVIPHNEVMNMFNNPYKALNSTQDDNSWKYIVNATNQSGKRIERALNGQRIPKTTMTGWTKDVAELQKFQTYRKSRFN